jgi:hypothetical protein
MRRYVAIAITLLRIIATRRSLIINLIRTIIAPTRYSLSFTTVTIKKHGFLALSIDRVAKLITLEARKRFSVACRPTKLTELQI